MSQPSESSAEGTQQSSAAAIDQAPASQNELPHEVYREPQGKNRSKDLLDGVVKLLPMRVNCLDPASMVADLPDDAQMALRQYLLERSPGSPEIVDALYYVAKEISREHLRTKELLETIEAVRHAGAWIDESRRKRKKSAGAYKGKHKGGALSDRLRGPTAIYDLACGKSSPHCNCRPHAVCDSVRVINALNTRSRFRRGAARLSLLRSPGRCSGSVQAPML